MRRLALGIGVGLLLSAPPLWALRPAQPPTFNQWTSNEFAQLNATLSELVNTLNGRYTFDVVTNDPDGSLKGAAGDALVYNTAGTLVLCVNTNDATDWDCASLAD